MVNSKLVSVPEAKQWRNPMPSATLKLSESGRQCLFCAGKLGFTKHSWVLPAGTGCIGRSREMLPPQPGSFNFRYFPFGELNHTISDLTGQGSRDTESKHGRSCRSVQSHWLFFVQSCLNITMGYLTIWVGSLWRSSLTWFKKGSSTVLSNSIPTIPLITNITHGCGPKQYPLLNHGSLGLWILGKGKSLSCFLKTWYSH